MNFLFQWNWAFLEQCSKERDTATWLRLAYSNGANTYHGEALRIGPRIQRTLLLLHWLVVWTPLKHMSSSVGMIIGNIWKKIKNVPSHQPVQVYLNPKISGTPIFVAAPWSAWLSSGKHTKNYGKIHHFQWVNPRTKWAIFNSFLYVYQRVYHHLSHSIPLFMPLNHHHISH